MADAEENVNKNQESAVAAPAAEPAVPAAESAAAPEKTASVPETETGHQTSSAAAPESGEARKFRRGGRVPSMGIAHIQATFNNTIVSITDMRGNVISWSSAGRSGFKGSRKSTSFAATMVGQDAARQAAAKGVSEVEVRVQGAGAGRESAIRAIQSAGLTISVIKDVTPVPHNGCRQRKRRRV